MPDELETPFEFHAGVTELRDSLGFTVQQASYGRGIRKPEPDRVHSY